MCLSVSHSSNRKFFWFFGSIFMNKTQNSNRAEQVCRHFSGVDDASEKTSGTFTSSWTGGNTYANLTSCKRPMCSSLYEQSTITGCSWSLYHSFYGWKWRADMKVVVSCATALSHRSNWREKTKWLPSKVEWQCACDELHQFEYGGKMKYWQQ